MFPRVNVPLQFHQQRMRDPDALIPCKHLVLSAFYFSHPSRYMLYITVVLIFVPLMASDIEHISICLFAIFLFPLVNVCSNLLPIFNRNICFLTDVFRILYTFTGTNPLSDSRFENIFSQYVVCLFTFSTGSFAEKNSL